MTIGAGHYGGRGARVEWQGRYRLSDRSFATANFSYLHDQTFIPQRNRWGFLVTEFQELPFDVDQKLRILEVSDNLFPIHYGDVPGRNEAFISSELIFSRAGDQVSSFVAFRRFRNLLNLDNAEKFDPNTVQVYPQAAVTTNDRFILDNPKIATGFTLGLTNFTRTAGGFDVNPFEPASTAFRPGIDPLREATRVSATPTVYTTLRLADRISIVPSAEYRAYFYGFHNVVRNLARGYGLVRVDMATQLERIYGTGDADIPRIKHLIRPQLSYSYIPFVNESSDHPFLRQIDYARTNTPSFSGFNFDNYDIVPRDNSLNNTNYFIPLGNSLSYGFTTQLIRRRGSDAVLTPSYQRAVELRSGQTFNFRELQKAPGARKPLSRFFAGLTLDFDRFSTGVDYFYQPYLPVTRDQRRHILSTALTYTVERSVKQEVWHFERSFSLGYYYNKVDSKSDSLRGTVTWSLNDYILPSAYIAHDFVSHVTSEAGATTKFQPASRCWGLELGPRFGICTVEERRGRPAGFCLKSFVFNLTLNLTGDGLGVGSLAGAKQ